MPPSQLPEEPMADEEQSLAEETISVRVEGIRFPFPKSMNARAERNHGGQSLARLDQRGGLCWTEALWIINDKGWRSSPIDEAGAEKAVREYFDRLAALKDRSPPSVNAGVTQADREAAAAMFRYFNSEIQGAGNGADGGYLDDGEVVQAFARHRQSALARPVSGEVGGLVERLRKLAEARRDFVMKRRDMNAARPDPMHATPAERALYDERYQADHEAERALFREASDFATWVADQQPADQLLSLQAALTAEKEQGERLREALSRATVRSYSHKQRDLSLEFERNDDLTLVVTSVAALSEGNAG